MVGRITLVLACSAVLGVACGLNGADEPLVAKLPTIIPQPGEVSEQVGSQWRLEAVTESTGEWNNQDVADAEGVSLQEVEGGGRIDGYRVFYQGGPSPSYPLVSVSITLSVYQNEESAEQALRRGPDWSAGPAVALYALGDAALSWPMSSVSSDSVSQKPSCPCQLWVRVGRLAGTVDFQFGGPPRIESQVSLQATALAQTMAARMADAQA